MSHGMRSRWRTIDDRRHTEVTGVRVSHCCARQGGYGVVPTLVRGYFNGPPLWICRCLITGVLNSVRVSLSPARQISRRIRRLDETLRQSFVGAFVWNGIWIMRGPMRNKKYIAKALNRIKSG